MSSRGAVAKTGKISTDSYSIVGYVLDAKILQGNFKQHHSLPDYSHSSNTIYVKLKTNGTMHELRVYENHKVVLEIAYHPEAILNRGNWKNNILHYHIYDEKLTHGEARILTKELKEKYKKYLKEFGLYD